MAADVYYLASGGARAAAVVAADAALSRLAADRITLVPHAEPYQPGRFYLRELPPLRAVLDGLDQMALLIIDGYADLDPHGRPGLGARARDEFGVPVIGVAKTAFRTATHAIAVRRGTSAGPLYVTAAGMPRADAAGLVRHMAGQHRLPDADDGNLDALAAADPVAGEQHRATYRAMRPDPAGKETAWQAALADEQDLQMAEAHARGLWVAGQEDLMAGYRDRYFTEALPALADREPRTTRRLTRLLYPATLVSPATVAATDAALQARHPGGQLRVIVQEQQAILRSALAARSTARRLNLS